MNEDLPPRRHVVLCVLCALVLLASGVIALHWHNAVSLRGVIELDGQPFTQAASLGVTARVEDVHLTRDVLHISGALMKAQVGEVRVRVALIARDAPQEALLLNTEMVRRSDLAQQYGCDDHCGFHAAVALSALAEGSYALVLADESQGAQHVIETDTSVGLSRDADGVWVLGVVRRRQPEPSDGEAKHESS